MSCAYCFPHWEHYGVAAVQQTYHTGPTLESFALGPATFTACSSRKCFILYVQFVRVHYLCVGCCRMVVFFCSNHFWSRMLGRQATAYTLGPSFLGYEYTSCLLLSRLCEEIFECMTERGQDVSTFCVNVLPPGFAFRCVKLIFLCSDCLPSWLKNINDLSCSLGRIASPFSFTVLAQSRSILGIA